MRLGQFARKLNIKPQEIVDYLQEKHNTAISVHPNSKVEDEFIDDLMQYFDNKKSKTTSISKDLDSIEEKTKDEDNQKETLEINQDSEKTKSTDEQEDALSPEEKKELENNLNIIDGTIKAPKVEVEGIKVVGKVEIPEPKSTEEENKENETASDEGVNKKDIKGNPNKSRRKTRKKPRKRKGNKNLSFQEKKKLELEKYEKEKQRKLELEKKKKKRHYEEKVLKKAKQNNSSKKKKKKNNSDEHPTAPEKQPKTMWGKFIRWLNT